MLLIVLLVYPPGYVGKGKQGELCGIYLEAMHPGLCSVHCMQVYCAKWMIVHNLIHQK